MYKYIGKIVIFIVCKILFKVEYENLEILDKYEKCMICANHSRIFDPVFLFPKIENMYSVAKSELFKNKFLASGFRYHRAIPIKRDKMDPAGVKNIINTINEKDKIRLLMFPEGGIYKENYLENKRKCKDGAVFISAETGVPIVTAYITSRPRFFSKVKVKFGEPFFPKKEVLEDRKLLKEESQRLINYIYQLGVTN